MKKYSLEIIGFKRLFGIEVDVFKLINKNIKMKESKFTKLGRERGKEVCLLISLLIKSRKERVEYIRDFLREYNSYSFKHHKVDEPRHEGCRSWIEEVSLVDYRNPRDYAKRCKADLDSLQQKDHAFRYYRGFLSCFKS